MKTVKGRPPKIAPDVLRLIKQMGEDGKSSPEIVEDLAKINIVVPERTVRHYVAENDLDKKVKKAVIDLLAEGALKTTLQYEIEQTAARKQFLLNEAAKIWNSMPKDEKNSSKMFIKLIELAQKDSEMLLRVMSLPERSIEPAQTDISKSLEEKLGILDEQS